MVTKYECSKICEVNGHGYVRLRFRLRSGTVGLLQDKKRCGLAANGRCVVWRMWGTS